MNIALVYSIVVGRFLDWRRMELIELVIDLYPILCLFRMVEEGFQWIFSRVYGPVERSFKEFFWEELGAIKGRWVGPWCLGGDFNEILFPNERLIGGRLSPAMRCFSETLLRPVSDHSPILLDNEGVRSGPSPFRFELMWLKFEGFKELLKWWWQSLKFHGTYICILAAKLKALKCILKVWNKEVFGRVEIKKKEAFSGVSF